MLTSIRKLGGRHSYNIISHKPKSIKIFWQRPYFDGEQHTLKKALTSRHLVVTFNTILYSFYVTPELTCLSYESICYMLNFCNLVEEI